MAKYLVEDTSLIAIADAIRSKTGETDTLSLGEMVNEIEQMGGGEPDTSVINALYDRTITEISNDKVTTIGDYAFYNCKQLTTANLPSVTTIGDYAFYNCKQLTTANLPSVTSLGSYAFSACSALVTIDLPSLVSIDFYALSGCSALVTIDLPSLMSIGSMPFMGCSKLVSLILRSREQCSLKKTKPFEDTPIKSGTGYIYVPSALVSSYKAATNWSTYANQFRALEDYTVDGTIDGELDETKI